MKDACPMSLAHARMSERNDRTAVACRAASPPGNSIAG